MIELKLISDYKKALMPSEDDFVISLSAKD